MFGGKTAFAQVSLVQAQIRCYTSPKIQCVLPQMKGMTIMRFEQLLYLLDVKKTGSFTKTGEHFYRSQQGISDALRKLEEEWQLTLLNRSKFGVTFTPVGEKMLPYVETLVNDYRRVEEQAQSLQAESLSGTLTLSVHPRFSHYLFEQSVLPFAKHYPQVTLCLNGDSTSQTAINVQRGISELGLVFLPNSRCDINNTTQDMIETHFVSETLYVDKLMLCVHQASPWSSWPQITQENLDKIPAITFEKRSEWFLSAPNLALEQPETISTANDPIFFKALLKNNLAAISLTPFEYAIDYQPDGCYQLLPIEGARPMKLALIYLRHKPLSQEAQCLIDIIRHIPFDQPIQ